MDIMNSQDTEIAKIFSAELKRQQDKINLIASENYASRAVLEAQGSIMTNKYAEGYPGTRYYHGCKPVDDIENLAIKRAKQLFRAEHVNVQPHSGSQANMAVYFALLNHDDTILAMNLAHGGHLTHGLKQNFSGQWYKPVFYGVNRKTHRIDIEEVRTLAHKHEPRMIIAGASAYPRQIDYSEFRKVADEVGAYLMVDAAHITGLIAVGLHPDPIPYADVVTTTTHKTLRGPRAGMIMCKKKFAGSIDRAVFPGIQSGPLMHVIAARAVAFAEAMKPGFKKYQLQVLKNARHMAECFKKESFQLVSDGTDNHLLLIDLSAENISGVEAANILEEAGIITNKNGIPFDRTPPTITSGIRLGAPAITTVGMKEPEVETITAMIAAILRNKNDTALRRKTKQKAAELCKAFPVYQWLQSET